MTKRPVKTWDLTLKFNEQRAIDLAKCLKELASQWAFQLEVSEEKKYKHWQIRIKLFHEKRKKQLKELCDGTPFQKARMRPTSTAASKTFNYVMKKDTRIDGPWTDKDSEMQDMPRQIKPWENNLRPFQESIKRMIQDDKSDDRKVNILYHMSGNIGGSQFGIWLEVKRIASFIPPFMDPGDMIQCVMGKPTMHCYYIDMPRQMDKLKLNGFWQGIEMMKTGFIYDKRHKWKQKIIDSPTIWVKTNCLPRREEMSNDRFVFWTVTDDYVLVPYEAPRASGSELDRLAAE